jgi:hypothetical protein
VKLPHSILLIFSPTRPSKYEDGWILGPNDELLLWVPPANRSGLLDPFPRSRVMGLTHITELDFSNFKCGTEWMQCREPIEDGSRDLRLGRRSEEFKEVHLASVEGRFLTSLDNRNGTTERSGLGWAGRYPQHHTLLPELDFLRERARHAAPRAPAIRKHRA